MDTNMMTPEITEKECYRILEQHIGEKNFQILNYEVGKARSKVMGYMGDHFRLKIHYRENPNSRIETEVFFVKSEPLSNITQAKYVEELGLFKKESMLYENVLSKLTAIAGNHFCPKFYLLKKNCLVLEDLSQKNFKVKESYLNLEECESLVKCLAVFHSATIIYEELNSKEGKEFRMNHVYREEINETAFSFVEGQPRRLWLENNTKCVSDCIKFKLKLKDADFIISKLHELVFNDMQTYIRASKKFRNTVTHCDLWANNFMMDHDLTCKLIDFQLARYNPPAYDLMLSLFLNTEKKLLQKHLERLLDLYYSSFENMLHQYKLPAKEMFSKRLFLESVQYYKLPTLLEAVYFTTNTLISSETSKYLLEDKERYHEFAFTNRSKYILQEYDVNESFRNGFLELLMPLIEILRRND